MIISSTGSFQVCRRDSCETEDFTIHRKVSVEQGVSQKEGDNPVYYSSNQPPFEICDDNSNCLTYTKTYTFSPVVSLYGNADDKFAEAPDNLVLYSHGKAQRDKICYYLTEEQTRVCYEKA